ncbi:MAG: hypothetical protein Q9219_005346 [cf. Caloplaca sp. 3 TL-2023]
MALSKAFVLLSRCSRCSSAILNALSGPANPRLPLASCINVSRLSGTTPAARRCVSDVPFYTSELVSWKSSSPDSQDSTKALEGEEDSKGVGSPDPLPWYLQQQTDQSEPKTLSDRQRLPDLPSDPPPLLNPILQHVSVDLGLDDLTLLDLRDIDPPPALGANLMMILGTARSEKHLHVSADRLCRWLRTTHKLTPYADGLLGRGELRLKLKRKNRRARMLNSVGASDKDNSDDGIRTGWVCVNIGTIEDGRAVEHDNFKHEDDDYVGFGGEISGVKMVVQMLTEEKREELDLETLWGQALRRYTRKHDRITMAGDQNASPSDDLPTSLEPNSAGTTPLAVPWSP